MSGRSKKSRASKDAAEWVRGEERRAESSAEVSALQRELASLKRRLRDVQGGEDLLIRAVQQTLGENPPELAIPPRPPRSRKPDEERALLHLTDWQGGKMTESYSVAVLDRRMRRLAEKVRTIVETRRSAARLERLVVILGGDMVEGENIYPGQAHEIELGVLEQSLRAVPDIAGRLLLDLLGIFDRVEVHAVCGNHGRPGPKSAGSHPKTNWDRVFYEYLRTCLLGTEWRPRAELAERLSFNVSETFYTIANVWDWGCLVVHGHEIGGGFAGFPWYGTAKKAWGWIDAIPEPWDYLYFGHFHQHASAVLNRRTFFCGGTPESGNTFALQTLAAAGHPSQRLQFFSERGGVISDHQVYLEEPGERLPQRLRPTKWEPPA